MVSQTCKTEVVWCRGSTKSHSKHYPVIPGCRIITRYNLLLLFSFWSIDDIMPFFWSTSGAVLTCSFVELTPLSLFAVISSFLPTLPPEQDAGFPPLDTLPYKCMLLQISQ